MRDQIKGVVKLHVASLDDTLLLDELLVELDEARKGDDGDLAVLRVVRVGHRGKLGVCCEGALGKDLSSRGPAWK